MAREAQLARHRQHFFDQTRLADPGLAADMDRAAATLRQAGVQHALQLGKLQTAAGQWGTRRWIERAVALCCAHDLPGHNGLRKALQRVSAEVAILEQLARQALRALRYDDRVGLRQSLQASGEVRGFADGAALRVGVGPDDVADEHRTGRNADAHGKSLRPRLELRDRRNDSKRGANGALGIVLRCNRITKISKRTISEILRHMAVKSSHRVGHAGMIGSDDFAEVLGIKAR